MRVMPFVKGAMRHFAAFALAALVAACGSSTPDPSKAFERTAAGGCPSTPQKLIGTKASGAACQDALECLPYCCSCSGSSKQWLAVSCRGGTCANPTVACLDTKDDAVLCN
jgi:hypothetical protein